MSPVEQRHQPRHQARHPSPSSPSRRRGNPVALTLGLVGLLVAGATFVVPNADLAGVCWTAGFALMFAAIVAVAVGLVHARGDRLSVLPTSAAGWLALACFMAAVALVFSSFAEFSLAVGLVAAAAAALAVGALRERSLPVIVLPLFGGMFALAFVLGELLVGHT